MDYASETIRARQEARAEAIARNQIVEGDQVQLKQKIRDYRGQEIVPLPDWMLGEGLYGRVEELLPEQTVHPKWWNEPHYAFSTFESQSLPPYALIVYPDLYLSSYDSQTQRVEFKYIRDYDCVNKDGEVVHFKSSQTMEQCENPELAGFALDEERVLINGVVHAVLQEQDCEVSLPAEWLEQIPGNQRCDY